MRARPLSTAAVVGSGPNGLVAAIRLARAGVRVRVFEAASTPGGGARTEEVTLPGFRSDICSAIHPTGVISPALLDLDLAGHGVRWVWSPVELAHPFDDGSAAVLLRSVDDTARTMGVDRGAWIDLFRPFLDDPLALFDDLLRPIRLPRRPGLMARFGLIGLQSAERLTATRFRDPKTRAIFAGCAAHSVVPLGLTATASFGMVLALSAHVAGWPCAERGSAALTEAFVSILQELGGTVETGLRIDSARELDDDAVLFDLTPRQVDRIAADALPARYRRRLQRFRYAPGVCKIDWALDGPVPWKTEACRQAMTVHLGGTFEEIAHAEREVWEGRHAERPFVLFAQQSLFDRSRAPEGRQTGWAYCHVPHGSERDMTAEVEGQIERFAPGFRERILARRVMTARDLEEHNPNMIGGDIGGGANDVRQFLTRPFPRWNPYATPDPRLYLCSSSTPPGGGVHGMCGLGAAETALARSRGDVASLLFIDRALRA